ncbi:SRP40, C-terminal domain-containing protein [Thelephora terrestris]|uniref:SRP40, C-terminal domain-containing protein n=1 Tax=Thelephora terrestris TaxID=56493 RepID=A0A9P6H7A3_9AGAM|nr:SRP40, C-terminal domain-containing protein [Thelephora terrestris]
MLASRSRADSSLSTSASSSSAPSVSSVASSSPPVSSSSSSRRVDDIGTSVTTSITQQPGASYSHQKGNPRKVNTPFSRIKVDEVKFADERLKDNRFESRKAAGNDYGAKANADLIVTKGAGFRKEKNKKKRGSYRGGEITMESHSIKFAD